MKLQALGTKILTNKHILKGLEKVSEHSSSFGAATALAMSLTLRPLSIMATPDTEKENKQYAAANSICSGLVKFAIIEAIALPLEYAVKKIDANPSKFLKPETMKNLFGSATESAGSRSYKLLTQTLKLSVGLITAIPKSMLTIALIPIVMDKIFANKFSKNAKKENPNPKNSTPNFTSVDKTPFFTGGISEKLTKGVANIIDKKPLQNFAIKFQEKDKDVAKHISAGTDILLTAAAIHQTEKSSGIKENRKRALIYNNIISTGITIAGGYLVDGLIKKSSEKFIEKFKAMNSGYKNISKCVEGINIIRPAIIFAAIYYGVLPIFSTYLSEKIDKFVEKRHP